MPEFWLDVIGPDLRSERLLGNGPETIGRAPGNSIVLGANGVSRTHARIERRGGELVIVDEGSSNGTSVNGSGIDPIVAYPLQNGDR
ncbi:MAG TPA: FHA domain-containing protein, partial [Dehalococcoidia bacterium]|nr:FHA domain-containing protein [Dehalococcoidia bacterium]